MSTIEALQSSLDLETAETGPNDEIAGNTGNLTDELYARLLSVARKPERDLVCSGVQLHSHEEKALARWLEGGTTEVETADGDKESLVRFGAVVKRGADTDGLVKVWLVSQKGQEQFFIYWQDIFKVGGESGIAAGDLAVWENDQHTWIADTIRTFRVEDGVRQQIFDKLIEETQNRVQADEVFTSNYARFGNSRQVVELVSEENDPQIALYIWLEETDRAVRFRLFGHEKAGIHNLSRGRYVDVISKEVGGVPSRIRVSVDDDEGVRFAFHRNCFRNEPDSIVTLNHHKWERLRPVFR